MSEPSISIRNLSKCYRLGTIGRHTLADEAQYWWHKLRGRDPRNYFGKIRHLATQKKVEAERENGQEFWALRDVSFDVRSGEILGFAGLIGSGRSNVAETIFGVTPATSGTIQINGKDVVIDQPKTAASLGIAFLTEDRKDTGCFLKLDVLENMQMALIGRK